MATILNKKQLDTGTLDVRPMTPAIGAEIHNIDLGASDIAARVPEIRSRRWSALNRTDDSSDDEEAGPAWPEPTPPERRTKP